MMTTTHPTANKRLSKKFKVSKILNSRKGADVVNGHKGLAAAMWALTGVRKPVLAPHDDPAHPRAVRSFLEKAIFDNF